MSTATQVVEKEEIIYKEGERTIMAIKEKHGIWICVDGDNLIWIHTDGKKVYVSIWNSGIDNLTIYR